MMEVKTFLLAMGAGAAAGTAVGMMLPKNRTMRQAGRNITSAAAEKLSEAADAVERKML